MTEDRHLLFKASLENIRTACDFVIEGAEEAGLDERGVYHCELAVDEACTNIIEHGFGRMASSEIDGEIEIITRAASGIFAIEIVDNSPSFNPMLYETPDPSAPITEREPGGWGIYFIRKLMDAIDYHYADNKNHLVLRKQVPPKPTITVVHSSDDLSIHGHPLEKGYWQVTLEGRLDSKTSPLLDGELKAILAKIVPPRLIVDLAGVEYVSSSGLKVLVTAWRQARDKKGDVLLTSLQPRTREVFEMIGFDMMFNIYNNPADALDDDPIDK